MVIAAPDLISMSPFRGSVLPSECEVPWLPIGSDWSHDRPPTQCLGPEEGLFLRHALALTARAWERWEPEGKSDLPKERARAPEESFP